MSVCECVCAERRGGFVHDVKHMSPRVLRQGGVSRDDGGEEEGEQVEAEVKRGRMVKGCLQT